MFFFWKKTESGYPHLSVTLCSLAAPIIRMFGVAKGYPKSGYPYYTTTYQCITKTGAYFFMIKVFDFWKVFWQNQILKFFKIKRCLYHVPWVRKLFLGTLLFWDFRSSVQRSFRLFFYSQSVGRRDEEHNAPTLPFRIRRGRHQSLHDYRCAERSNPF